MRIAWLVLLAACGGAAKSAAPMAPVTPAATSTPAPEPATVAINDPAPPPPPPGGPPRIAPDPCEGGELTPASSGGPPAEGGGGIGHGIGAGNPCGGRGMRGRGHGPVVHLKDMSAQGGLDKAIIRRYIKRNVQKIQYCYEKELLARPGIKGTVSVKFEIGVDGLVTTSVGTGLDVVAGCVADVIKTIEFPKPKSVTAVVYPFEFAATE